MKTIPPLLVLIAVIFLAGCSTTSSHRDFTGSPAAANTLPLTPQQSTEATQAARSFLEAVRNEDWNAVAKFWPQDAPKHFDDIFTEKTKGYVGGLKIISLGTPYMERPRSWVFVPYEVRFKNGDRQTNSLRIRQHPDGHWDWVGGF